MMKSKADIQVMKTAAGKVFFASTDCDLSKETLSCPVKVKDTIGTIEFFLDKVIYHPANGDDTEFAPEAIIEMMESGEIQWG